MNQPYISFVATSRNDNHGGDMKKRMHIFLTALRHQCNKYQLPCELIMVDWNSPDPNELLDKVLEPSKEGDYLQVRYVEVPNEEHVKLRYHDILPLFQMIAKNVGIRRTKAPFVVCTNVDLLFSDDLFKILARKELKEGFYYRANRCDVPNAIYEYKGVEEQLRFCEKNIVKRLGKHNVHSIFSDPDGILTRTKAFKPLVKGLSKLKRKLISRQRFLQLMMDFDACGDFTLMSKKDWERIDGYVELEMYSLHIDSMCLYACIAQGMDQVIFPPEACSYHIEHTGGWEISDPVEKLRFFEKKPSLEWWAVSEAGRKIIKEKSNFNINSENWGLADKELKELNG